MIVVGAGHAGVEAAWAAAQLGCSVGLCTLSRETTALMPCNPAVGGTAKGHLVREIDALGGLMGRAIDATGIQFKMLNRSRGPAVWSPRAQADKQRYSEWVRAALEAHPNIEWVLGRAGRILDRRRTRRRSGVRGWRRAWLSTPGHHDGNVPERPDPCWPRTAPGRARRRAAVTRPGRVAEVPWRSTWGRLKTGTPPRLARRSIDFDGGRRAGGVPRGTRRRSADAVLLPHHRAAD